MDLLNELAILLNKSEEEVLIEALENTYHNECLDIYRKHYDESD